MKTLIRFLVAVEFLCVVIAIIAAIDRNPFAAGTIGLVGVTLLMIHAGILIGRLDRFQREETVKPEDLTPDDKSESN